MKGWRQFFPILPPVVKSTLANGELSCSSKCASPDPTLVGASLPVFPRMGGNRLSSEPKGHSLPLRLVAEQVGRLDSLSGPPRRLDAVPEACAGDYVFSPKRALRPGDLALSLHGRRDVPFGPRTGHEMRSRARMGDYVLGCNELDHDKLFRDKLARDKLARDKLARGQTRPRQTRPRTNSPATNSPADNLARDKLARGKNSPADKLARNKLARDKLARGINSPAG